ncbi:MAG: hypothetical protein A2Y25_04200 [Candidatus Melainabacteria bacterium GWF2_37_15]|nr:MAG: hypothetical protein A2Y25_04200 [Candidatus Melainabacteria bacterium GWF2_37_15]
MNKNIVLIGLMGSGKSTIGKCLAEKTSMEFFDTDELIIQKAGKPISKIFEDAGEPFFRDLESEAIEEVSKKQNAVISTGGGAVLRDENMENLKKSGILFFLQASPETLYERVKDDKSRPLLRGDDPAGILRRILIARTPFYEQANFNINTENSTVEQVCEEILRLYYGHSN